MCKSFCQRKLYAYANGENVNIVMIKLAYTSYKNSFIIAILPYTMKNGDSYEEYGWIYAHAGAILLPTITTNSIYSFLV